MPRFVVQHHRASTDHYDFRLEIGAVLVSWAVPRGPSLDPGEHRLAIRTGDHELDYADYEGTTGKRGGGYGVVIVWDFGTFRNISHQRDTAVGARDALDRGHLSVWLDGHKLHGGFTLIRTAGYGSQDSWLLTKRRDEHEDRRHDLVANEPRSVLTDRLLDDIPIPDEGYSTTDGAL